MLNTRRTVKFFEVSEEELSEDYILPKALNKNVAKAVAEESQK